jgi:hypothetical protein
VDRLRTVASVIADDEHYADSASPSAGSSAADFKPAAPHPLENYGGSAGPATGEPPSGA